MDKSSLRIVFFGTPPFAVATLRCLVESGYGVVAVVTGPDRRVGRRGVLSAPAVKDYALQMGLPVLQPERLSDGLFVAALASYRADVQVVVAFRMLPKVVWSQPRWGTFNVHASLLPQYRGAAPIHWALINGERETGVTTFCLDEQLDTGQIIAQQRCAIPSDADYAWLADRLMVMAAALAVETLERFIAYDGRVPTVPQEASRALHAAPKIFTETCQILWDQPAQRVYDFIRGLSPSPGAWTSLSIAGTTPETVKIYRSAVTSMPSPVCPGELLIVDKRLLVATHDYWLELLEVQRAGRRRMHAIDIINGLHGHV